ncbi:MAG: hypothetical protein NTY30_01410 [Candidatus Berkelbacteria bacterium]|nr:hypothetical protein [Candidatus Berkelbacteria bacterium]
MEDEEKKEERPEEKTASEQIVLPTKKKPNLLWLWILIAVIVAAGGTAAFAYRGAIKDKFWPKKTETASTSTATTTTPTTSSIKIVDDGITWLNLRVKLADLGLFKGSAHSADDIGDGYVGTDYYKVATTTDGGEIILAIAKVSGMGTFDDFHHFLKKAGVYYWLSENSDAVGGDGGYYARTNSDINGTLSIKSLQLDKTLTKGTTKLTQDTSASRGDAFVAATTVGTKIEETKWGDIYLLKGTDIDKSNGDAKVAQYYILRNDGIRMIYHPEPTFRNDDGTLNITWSNAAGKDQKFSQIKTSGCGGAGGSFPIVLDTESLKTKTEVGSASGSKVYTVSADSTLAEFAYQIYLMDGMTGKASKATMMADLGLIVLQDGYGNWEGYLNDKYAPAVECGKPVIYLYPTKSEQVSVKVGADITKSDPAYNSGWKVVASPSGLLTTDNGLRDSLFWEGTGWGQYPAITSGTVVESAKVSETITSQLGAMGLNAKEIADFKDFWMAKMPTTPYTRLTWLTTEQMNTLAPLAVSPKPDTMIRVFLDFSGQQTSATNLVPQVLPHYQRNGFTLVEWGGLLRAEK